jgi:hypothetical protein
MLRTPSQIRPDRDPRAKPKRPIRGSQGFKGNVIPDSIHRRPKEQPKQKGKRQEQVLANHHPIVRGQQKSRRSIGPNPRSVGPPYVETKSVGRQKKERVQSPAARQTSRPKTVFQANPQTYTDRRAEARVSKQTNGQLGTRGEIQSQSHPDIRRSWSQVKQGNDSVRSSRSASRRARR